MEAVQLANAYLARQDSQTPAVRHSLRARQDQRLEAYHSVGHLVAQRTTKEERDRPAYFLQPAQLRAELRHQQHDSSRPSRPVDSPL